MERDESGRKERNQLLFARNVVRGKWRTEGWPDVMAPSTQPRLLPSGIRSVSIVPLHPALTTRTPPPRPSDVALSCPLFIPRSVKLQRSIFRVRLSVYCWRRVFARYRIGDVSARDLYRKPTLTGDFTAGL